MSERAVNTSNKKLAAEADHRYQQGVDLILERLPMKASSAFFAYVDGTGTWDEMEQELRFPMFG